jgi:hypothetical protein
MESQMEESILHHEVVISRIKDCNDDMNICKNDVDMLKLEQGTMDGKGHPDAGGVDGVGP